MRTIPKLAFLGVAAVGLLSVTWGCAAPGGITRIGTLENISDSSATLDLSFIRAVTPTRACRERIPIGSRWTWDLTLSDSGGRRIPTRVELSARHLQWGWMAYSCPVWTLSADGRSASKDTEGYGHWLWEGNLQVGTVKLAVYNHGKQAMVYLAE